VEGQQDEAHAERVHLMLCQHDTPHTHVDTRRHTTHTSLATLHTHNTPLILPVSPWHESPGEGRQGAG
jgi:hypothetical protein